MESTNQAVTRQTYEDPAVAQAFLAKNGEQRHGVEHIWQPLQEFADTVGTGHVLDIGCGPGIHARQFARLGFDVTAIDYSSAMIDAAVAYGEAKSIVYRHLDMRDIGSALPPASFDAAWASASLIHVPEVDVPAVLAGTHDVLKPGGLFRLSLKCGKHRAEMVRDDKYGLITDREFVFWEEEEVTRLLRAAGFDIVNVQLAEGGVTGTGTTRWLNYLVRRRLTQSTSQELK